MTNHLTGGPPVPLRGLPIATRTVVYTHNTHSGSAGRCSILHATVRPVIDVVNAHVASFPSGLKGGRLILALPEGGGEHIARHAIEACVAGSGALRIRHRDGARTASGDVRLLKTSSPTLLSPVH